MSLREYYKSRHTEHESRTFILIHSSFVEYIRLYAYYLLHIGACGFADYLRFFAYISEKYSHTANKFIEFQKMNVARGSIFDFGEFGVDAKQAYDVEPYHQIITPYPGYVDIEDSEIEKGGIFFLASDSKGQLLELDHTETVYKKAKLENRLAIPLEYTLENVALIPKANVTYWLYELRAVMTERFVPYQLYADRFIVLPEIVEEESGEPIIIPDGSTHMYYFDEKAVQAEFGNPYLRPLGLYMHNTLQRLEVASDLKARYEAALPAASQNPPQSLDNAKKADWSRPLYRKEVGKIINRSERYIGDYVRKNPESTEEITSQMRRYDRNDPLFRILPKDDEPSDIK